MLRTLHWAQYYSEIACIAPGLSCCLIPSLEFSVLQETTCKIWCTVDIPKKDAKFVSERIKEEYRINMMIDNLPVATKDESSGSYSIGFLLGEQDSLHNHYEFTVHYHVENNNQYRVVGLLAKPSSVSRDENDPCIIKGTGKNVLSKEIDNSILFSYSVMWEVCSCLSQLELSHFVGNKMGHLHEQS